jgi:RNA polymerase sigma-70 factor (ECF subfamily)
MVQTHGETVWRIAVRLLGNEEDARDCYQQTFFEALRLRNQPVDNWRSLLSSIATRRAIDQLRRRYRERRIRTDEPAEAMLDEPPEAALEEQELRRSIRQTLAASPAGQAEAFWLRHIEQLSTSEVAKQLGVTPGHVRVLVHRAAKHLRVALGPTYGVEIPHANNSEGENHEQP